MQAEAERMGAPRRGAGSTPSRALPRGGARGGVGGARSHGGGAGAPPRDGGESALPHDGVESALSRDVVARLRSYVVLLRRWNAAINLIGRADAASDEAVWRRHVADCLRLLPLMPAGAAAATDLGSGAGLPGLVLAVASGVPFALVEADRRKAAFLAEAARVAEAPVAVHCARIEEAGLPPAPLVTARALAPLPRLLGYAYPLLAPGGTCLFPKGAGSEAEIAEARRQGWRFTLERHDDPARPGSTVLRVTDLARA